MEHKLSEFAFIKLPIWPNEFLISNPEDYSAGFFKIGNILSVSQQKYKIIGVSIKYLLGEYCLAVKVQDER